MYVKCRLEVIKDYKCVWIGLLSSLRGGYYMNTLLWVDFDFFFLSFFLVLIYNRKEGKKASKGKGRGEKGGYSVISTYHQE